MKIYFAGSIRGGRDDARSYMEIINILDNFGEVLTEHIGNESLLVNELTMTDREIYLRDMEWLNGSDILVAEVTQPSLGVGYELAMARAAGKKVLCLFNTQKGKQLSAMISGDTYFEIKNYDSIKQLQEFFPKYFVNNA